MPEQADAAKPVVVQALTDEEILARLLSSRPEPSILERERGFDRVMRRVDARAGLGERLRLARHDVVALPAIAAGVALVAGVALWLWPSHDEEMAAQFDTGSPNVAACWWGSGTTSPDETPSSHAALEIPPVESSGSVVDFPGVPSEFSADGLWSSHDEELWSEVGDWLGGASLQAGFEIAPVESSSSVVGFPGVASELKADVSVPTGEAFSSHKSSLSADAVWTPGPEPSFALLCSDAASAAPPVEPTAPTSCSQDARLSFAVETPRHAPYVAVMGAQPRKPLLWLLPAPGEETPYKSHWFTSQYSIALAELPAGEYEITLAFFEHPLPRTEVVQQLRKRESARSRVITQKLTVTPGRAKAPASSPTRPRPKSKGPTGDRNQSMRGF